MMELSEIISCLMIIDTLYTNTDIHIHTQISKIKVGFLTKNNLQVTYSYS